ncbi:MAG TPA: ABC-2 family transporter protein [Mycobacteriales bacterium]|nr:ABC-2 family transporter protein [Mycobacteriales bacterium]
MAEPAELAGPEDPAVLVGGTGATRDVDRTGPVQTAGARPPGAVRTYLMLVRMWTRASWQYPTSLLLLTATQLLATTMDFATILIVFAHTRSLAGFPLAGVMFLYGTSATAFGLADLAIGNVDRLGRHIRLGTFDVMLVRPASALAQLAAEEFSPRRVGKLATALPVLAVALTLMPVRWDAGRVLAVPVMVGAATLIYAALWIIFSTTQFVAGDSPELLNTVVAGGSFLTQYPLAIYGREVVRGLTWVVPLAFVNWQPALYVLGRPDPFGLPAALRFASPGVALVLTALAALAWRAGIRHYRSTGS